MKVILGRVLSFIGCFVILTLPDILLEVGVISDNASVLTIFAPLSYLLLIVLAIYYGKKRGLLGNLTGLVTRRWLTLVLLGYLAVYLVSLLGSLLLQLESGGDSTFNQNLLKEMLQQVPAAVMVLKTVFFAPLLEELVFRGMFAKVYFPNHQKLGLVIGNLLFLLVHVPTNFSSVIIYGGMGAILAYAYYRTDRLETSIAIHFVNNLIATVLMFLL